MASPGTIGYVNGIVIDKCTVKDATISNVGDHSSANTGGLIGFTPSGSITDCNAENVTISAQSTTIGGIVGRTETGTISGCNVTGCNLNNSMTGQTYTCSCAGGITGFAPSIQNCNVKNTSITSTNEEGVGGILGHGKKTNTIETIIQNCTVEGCTISAKSMVGGISGAAVATLSGCTVKNTSVTGTGSKIGGIQGYGGVLATNSSTRSQTPVTMTNCHVINGTIRGASDVGQLQGKNSEGISGVSDTFTGCDYDSQTTIQ